MAILYIGPHRNPDFASDYHLSPILAPAELLAQFPLMLMSCGEKDPFVDDTIIFAGRLREAKRARLRELELAINNPTPSVKYGEHLRMSAVNRDDESTMRAMRRERDVLAAQTEEDWVRMQIFSDWSHGYLQMPMLMQEARTVIYELADSINEVFADASVSNVAGQARRLLRRGGSMAVPRVRASPNNLDKPLDEDYLSSMTSTSETEVETDDALTFVPKKKSPPPSISSASNSRGGTVTTSGGKDLSATPRLADRGLPSANLAASGLPSPPSSSVSPRLTTTSTNPSDGSTANGTAPHHTTVRESTVSTPLDMLSGFVGGSSNLGILGSASVPETSSSSSSTPPLSTVGSPGKSALGGTAVQGKTGQTISESELMRRRRLLDAHLLPSNENQTTTVLGLGLGLPKPKT